MCFLSLIGLAGIYKTYSSFASDKLVELTIAVFLIPSVLFWGSGALKEGLIIFALGILIYNLYKSLYGNIHILRHFIFFIASAILLFFTKMYVFIALSPAIISLIIVKLSGNKFVFLKFAGIHLLFFIIAVNIYQLNDNWDTLLFLHQKQMGFIQRAIIDKARSYIDINYLEPTTFSLIKNTPQAIINTLCRPHLFESKSIFILVSAIENLLLIISLAITIVFFKKPNKEILPLFYTGVFFVFTLALLIGLLTPVLGSIVRYRVPIIPFYAITLILLIDKEKIIKKLSTLNLYKRIKARLEHKKR